MSGIRTFATLGEAMRAGFYVYDKVPNGYLVRTRTAAGYALAIVDLTL
jgi:hypothetical protein